MSKSIEQLAGGLAIALMRENLLAKKTVSIPSLEIEIILTEEEVSVLSKRRIVADVALKEWTE